MTLISAVVHTNGRVTDRDFGFPEGSIISGTLISWSLTIDASPPLPVELINFEVE